MGGVVKSVMSIFGGGSEASAAPAQAPAPVAPPIAPPAYSNPHATGDAQGNISNSQRAAGAFSDTIITGPEGLKTKESTSNTQLKSTLGS